MQPLLWAGLTILMSLTAHAENYFSPLPCAAEEVTLSIHNKTDDPQEFWFQKLGHAPFEEVYVPVKPRGDLHVELREFGFYAETALAIKTRDASLSFEARCKSTQKTWALGTQNSPWKKLSLSNPSSELYVSFVNLSQQENTLTVTTEDLLGLKTTKTLKLSESFESSRFLLPLPWGTQSVKIQGQGRWSGKAFDSLGQELTFSEEPVHLNAPSAQTRYFLFSSEDPTTLDSFVVPMNDPKLIQQTLEQIQNPMAARLLVARIEKSLQGFNRDFSSSLKTPWSWQVVEAQNYADFAHISCDGTPGLVEERLNSWLLETGSSICFWSYRVKRELSPLELKLRPLWSPLAP